MAAPVERVWALVSDLPRLAEWSPQVVRSIKRSSGPIQLGTALVNINRRGPLVWPTRSRVVRFEPHREIAFRITDNQMVWSFTLEPIEADGSGGTRITQRRQAPDGIGAISRRLIAIAFGGQETYGEELRQGMRATLARVKVAAEG